LIAGNPVVLHFCLYLMNNKDEKLKFGRGINVEKAHRRCCLNIGFAASGAGQTNISQLQIQAVVRAGQTTLNFGS
jgi:hypothetical protein